MHQITETRVCKFSGPEKRMIKSIQIFTPNFLLVFFIFYVPVDNFYSHVGTGLPWLN